MIEFQNVSKRYGAQVVLSETGFRVDDGDHVGVVGPNGAGKSTLFGMIVGDITPDGGAINAPRDYRIGYVRQMIPDAAGERSLLDYVQDGLPELRRIHADIERLEHRFHEGAVKDRDGALRELGALQTDFEARGGYEIRTRAEVTLGGLGFPESRLQDPLHTFSGGWRMRAEMARALVAQPNALLLDEPSNYLDIPAVEWLQRYLSEFSGLLMLISHDRFLLNSLTTQTIEVANGRATRYPGNYDRYLRDREQRYAAQRAAQKNQARKREQMERFIERFRAKNTLATRVKSQMKKLEKMEDIDVLPEVGTRGRIRLRPPPHCGHEIIRLEDAAARYEQGPWVLRHVDLRLEKGDKLALVGMNGMGKSTLLRLLAGKLPLAEGKRVMGHRVTVGYQSQDFAETLAAHASVLEAVRSVAPGLREEEVRTLLGGFGFSGDSVLKSIDVLSGGEKIRVAFARLLASPPNFLVLDEPTTHLDIASRVALEEALSAYEGTLCFVSHDITFVRRIATGIVSLHPPGIRQWPGGYDYYREKRAAEEAAATGSRQPATAPAEERGGDRKAQRRRRAHLRRELHERTKDLKKQMRRVERQITVFETERDRLVATLSEAVAQTDFAALNKRLATIQKELVNYTERWEKLGLELEEIENDVTHGDSCPRR